MHLAAAAALRTHRAPPGLAACSRQVSRPCLAQQSSDAALHSALATAQALMPAGSTALAAFASYAASQAGSVCSLRCTVDDVAGEAAIELSDALLGCGAQSARWEPLCFWS